MAMQPFFWGSGGQKISSPEQAERQRQIALALQNRPAADSWESGLANLTNGLAGMSQENRVAEAEAEGRQRAGGLFADLATNADPNSIIAALTSPDAQWATPSQTSIASALLNSGLKRDDPLYQAQLSKAQREASGVLSAADMPSSIQEWNIYNNLSPEDQSRYLTMKRSNSPLNLGDRFVTQDQASPGQTIGDPIAINNQAAAFDTSTGAGLGKANAENIVSYESLASKMPGLRENMAELGDLATKATYTQTGQLIDKVMRESGQEPSENAVARTKYIAAVDNQVLPLLRDTFGAAFTEREGATLRNTLGDPDKSPVEKQAILDAFIDQKERDLAAMQSRIPGASPSSAGGDQVFDAADFFGGN